MSQKEVGTKWKDNLAERPHFQPMLLGMCLGAETNTETPQELRKLWLRNIE